MTILEKIQHLIEDEHTKEKIRFNRLTKITMSENLKEKYGKAAFESQPISFTEDELANMELNEINDTDGVGIESTIHLKDNIVRFEYEVNIKELLKINS